LEPFANSDQPRQYFRAQDILVWALLFAAVALLGPDRSAGSITALCALGVFQIFERRILDTPHGGGISFTAKLALCALLLGFTNGIASRYFWMLILPVISAGTSMGLIGTTIAIEITCLVFLLFIYQLPPDAYIEDSPELLLRVLILPVIGYLTHELAESNRIAARKYQTAAEQLAEANAHLQEAEDAVRRSDRLAALGQLSAGLAHELRNPLGTIKASAEMLSKNIGNGDELAREMVDFISSEVDRTNSLVTRFLDFARPLALRPEKTDLDKMIDRAIDQVERHQPPFDVSIYKNYSPDIPPFPFDGELMERVIYNLLLNAAQASPPKSAITVKTRHTGDMAEVSVIDRGAGIDPKHLENIFNPFFTTKRGGVGLGLAIVSKIVDEHGGRMAVESEPGHGSVFRVYLPMTQAQPLES
jgi:signal transduction histidine kinase